jgi:hypothetical protein
LATTALAVGFSLAVCGYVLALYGSLGVSHQNAAAEGSYSACTPFYHLPDCVVCEKFGDSFWPVGLAADSDSRAMGADENSVPASIVS